jgi:hypothetical protein
MVDQEVTEVGKESVVRKESLHDGRRKSSKSVVVRGEHSESSLRCVQSVDEASPDDSSGKETQVRVANDKVNDGTLRQATDILVEMVYWRDAVVLRQSK